MRILAIDFGSKRIGVAVADTDARVVGTRKALVASGKLATDAENIKKLAASEEAGVVVVGLPIEASGEEGKMARICRQLANRLRELGVDVELVDESLTSVAAHASLQEAGHKASVRRRLVDGEAAANILERYLDAQASR